MLDNIAVSIWILTTQVPGAMNCAFHTSNPTLLAVDPMSDPMSDTGPTPTVHFQNSCLRVMPYIVKVHSTETAIACGSPAEREQPMHGEGVTCWTWLHCLHVELSIVRLRDGTMLCAAEGTTLGSRDSGQQGHILAAG